MHNHHHPHSTPTLHPLEQADLDEKSDAPGKRFWLPPSLPLVGRLQMPSLKGVVVDAFTRNVARAAGALPRLHSAKRVPNHTPTTLHLPPDCMKLRGLSKRRIVSMIEKRSSDSFVRLTHRRSFSCGAPPAQTRTCTLASSPVSALGDHPPTSTPRRRERRRQHGASQSTLRVDSYKGDAATRTPARRAGQRCERVDDGVRPGPRHTMQCVWVVAHSCMYARGCSRYSARAQTFCMAVYALVTQQARTCHSTS
jgi:hypothetical protein